MLANSTAVTAPTADPHADDVWPESLLPVMSQRISASSTVRPPVHKCAGPDPHFRNRRHAGRVLAGWLLEYTGHAAVLVLARPRAIPIAAAIAEALAAPLAVFCVHTPYRVRLPQRAMRVISMSERAPHFPSTYSRLELMGSTIILVDDGLTPAVTLRTMVQTLRRRDVTTVAVAAPVLPLAAWAALYPVVDDLVSAIPPELVGAVPDWYDDLTPPRVAEVNTLLVQAAHWAIPNRPVGAATSYK